MGNLGAILSKFWTKPFDPNGDAINWVLFLGLLLIAAWGWSRVINKIPT